jgi:hypothetical protein
MRRQTHGHASPPPPHPLVAMTHFAQGSEQTLERTQTANPPTFLSITFTSSLSLSLATHFFYLFPPLYACLFLCSDPFYFFTHPLSSLLPYFDNLFYCPAPSFCSSWDVVLPSPHHPTPQLTHAPHRICPCDAMATHLGHLAPHHAFSHHCSSSCIHLKPKRMLFSNHVSTTIHSPHSLQAVTYPWDLRFVLQILYSLYSILQTLHYTSGPLLYSAWEADSCFATQQILNMLHTPKVHLPRSHKPDTGPYPELDESTPPVPSHFFQTYLNIIFPSMHRS